MVLLAPDVPAVLLEMGFITNADDEQLLSDPGRATAPGRRRRRTPSTILFREPDPSRLLRRRAVGAPRMRARGMDVVGAASLRPRKRLHFRPPDPL
jgi:hypothetical protein